MFLPLCVFLSVCPQDNLTRNSAVADKPRDAFFANAMALIADSKNTSLPVCDSDIMRTCMIVLR